MCLLEFKWMLADMALWFYLCLFERVQMNTGEPRLKEVVEAKLGRRLSKPERNAMEQGDFYVDLEITEDIEQVAADFIEHLGVEKADRTPRIRRVSTERERLLARLAADAAGGDLFVKGFRARYLGGDVLPPKKLPEWLKQQEASFTHGRTWSSLQLPPGPAFQRQDGRWTLAEGVGLDAAIHRRTTRTLSLTDPEDPDGVPLRADIGGVGALHTLEMVAQRLADTFRWAVPDAAAFVLTGHVPAVSRQRGTISVNHRAPSLSKIEMSIDPDCTSQEVAAFFAELKGTMGFKGRGLARSDKPVRLMSFALDKGPVTYEAFRRLWNEKVGEEDAYGDRSAIRLALKRATKLILEPTHSEVQSNVLLDSWQRLVGLGTTRV